jgi:hypothetical protein
MASAARVEAHVLELAGAIGARSVSRPQALHAAADYVEQTGARKARHLARADQRTAARRALVQTFHP